MAYFHKDGASIYYEVRGRGTPLLLFAPGGLHAVHDWERTAFNAVEDFSEDFRVIAFDQRNAGRSTGPVPEGDPGSHYLADHLGLLNHLGIEKCLILGACIGPSYMLRMMREAPQRVMGAILNQPIGQIEANRAFWVGHWGDWAKGLAERRSEIDAAEAADFGQRMWASDFVFSVTREDVAACPVPMMVMPGIDEAHPREIGLEIAGLAPNVELVDPWKQPADLLPAAVAKMRAFLHRHAGG